MEIERKYLTLRLPEGLERFPHSRLEQAYLSVDPVIRVRSCGDGTFRLTVKGEGFLAREEFELLLTEEAYRRLLAKAEGNHIVKTRYRIPWEGYTIELDLFEGDLAPLIVAEVEFPDAAAAERFRGPDWFGQEVTEDPAYSNSALSRRAPGQGKTDG